MAVEPSQFFMVGTDGVPYSIHMSCDTAAVAGVYANLDMNQPASANSLKTAKIQKDSYITDLVMLTDPTGVYELISNGHKTGIFITQDMHVADSPGRPPLRVPLSRGTELSVQVATAPTA